MTRIIGATILAVGVIGLIISGVIAAQTGPPWVVYPLFASVGVTSLGLLLVGPYGQPSAPESAETYAPSAGDSRLAIVTPIRPSEDSESNRALNLNSNTNDKFVAPPSPKDADAEAPGPGKAPVLKWREGDVPDDIRPPTDR